LAHSNLGWPVDLGGTGTCITGAALAAAGGFGDELVEDADLATRLTLAGSTAHWAHDVRVRDEKPASAGVAIRQRGRWLAGRRRIARRRVLPLVRHGVRTRRWGPIDQALRLIRPSRTMVAAGSIGFAVIAAVATWPGLFPWQVWAVAAAVQMMWPAPFLLRDRVPLRYVAALPLLGVFVVLWAPIRLAAVFTRSWSRTPHRGSSTDEGREEPDAV
jgi:cellulose synthase/poly-beta-1,6-N-acetylglucosamine synthase-like glycosyltransferase